MKYVVVDLEMNGTLHRRMLNQEVIEIGAVVVDENYNRISEFITYVKPEMNTSIERKISKLTGITDANVENAPTFADAFGMFSSFCKSLKDEVKVVAWSDNDKSQMEREMGCKGYVPSAYEQELLDNWVDFQKEFDDLVHLERNVSLKDALMFAGLEFAGRAHDALFDARNTAELFAVVRTEERRKEVLDRCIEYLTPKACSTSLGDLFDFSAFAVAM